MVLLVESRLSVYIAQMAAPEVKAAMIMSISVTMAWVVLAVQEILRELKVSMVALPEAHLAASEVVVISDMVPAVTVASAVPA